jgi:hypothetical protein
MTINTYHIGQKVRLTATFTALGVNTDPTTVTLKVKDPSGVITPYTYALAQIIRSAAGIYYKDISIDEAGDWYYNFTGTGTVEAADETFLSAEESQF